MAVAAWKIVDKQGKAQKSFTVAVGGDFVPQYTSYLGGATWIALTTGGKISIVHVVNQSGVLHSYEAFSFTHDFGFNYTPKAVTYDGKYVWVLVATATIPVTYELAQLRSPRSTTILPTYAMSTPSGEDLVGLCMDGPGFGGDDFKGRYFYTIGGNDTVYKLLAKPNLVATVVASYAVTAGLRGTFSGLEFDGKDFWAITQRTDRFGAQISGLLKHYTADWTQVEQWFTVATATGMSTDGHRFWSRTD